MWETNCETVRDMSPFYTLIFTSVSPVQLLSRVRLFMTPWIAARQASLSITNSRSSLKLTSISLFYFLSIHNFQHEVLEEEGRCIALCILKCIYNQTMVFPVVMYGCKSWTVKKAEHQRVDAFELWCWRRLVRVPWTARRSNQSILKEISPGISLEGMMLKLKL